MIREKYAYNTAESTDKDTMHAAMVCGNHEALVKQEGFYNQLYQSQFDAEGEILL